MVGSRIKLNPGFWSHHGSVPLSSDLSRASIFDKHSEYLVFDLETKTLVDAVGGWENFKKLEVSIACAYDSVSGEVKVFREEELKDLVRLCQERLVIGYNSDRFDLPILEKYGLDIKTVDSFDLMVDVSKVTGRPFVKLEKLAQDTLGEGKTADGTQATEWWKEGKIDKIIEYCKQDVIVTRDLFHYGRDNGYIVLEKVANSGEKNKIKKMEKVDYPVDWK